MSTSRPAGRVRSQALHAFSTAPAAPQTHIGVCTLGAGCWHARAPVPIESVPLAVDAAVARPKVEGAAGHGVALALRDEVLDARLTARRSLTDPHTSAQ